jgi:hypothetical protein
LLQVRAHEEFATSPANREDGETEAKENGDEVGGPDRGGSARRGGVVDDERGFGRRRFVVPKLLAVSDNLQWFPGGGDSAAPVR